MMASVHCQRLIESEKKLFNCVMFGMMYTCGSMLAGFKDPTNPKNCCYYILDKYIVRANNTCARPV